VTVAPAWQHPEEDQRVVLRGMTWGDYESMLGLRGDRAGVRLYYLDGEIELMSPAKTHEGRKKTLARLLELWAMEAGVPLEAYGSWTLKGELEAAGAEPDECYIVGDADRSVPDLVIEVEWSRVTGLAKREIYRRLGVRELWTLTSSAELVLATIEGDVWVERSVSEVLPALDVRWLSSFLVIEPQSKAVRALRDALAERE